MRLPHFKKGFVHRYFCVDNGVLPPRFIVPVLGYTQHCRRRLGDGSTGSALVHLCVVHGDGRGKHMQLGSLKQRPPCVRYVG